MKYNFNPIQSAEFCCETCLVCDILEVLDIGAEEYKSVSVIGDISLMRELLMLFLSIESETGFSFSPKFIDINEFDYEDMYTLSVSNNGDLCIETTDGINKENGISYVKGIEADLVYIHEYCDEDVVEMAIEFGNNVLIFGFDEE